MTPTKENLTIEITKKLSVEVPAAEMESAAKYLSEEAGRRLTVNDIVNVCLSDGALINELQNFSILDTVARERFHIVLEEYIKTNELEGAETFKYATVKWTVDDILTLRPEWTKERAEEFLDINEKYIQARLVELGWEVIESMLD